MEDNGAMSNAPEAHTISHGAPVVNAAGPKTAVKKKPPPTTRSAPGETLLPTARVQKVVKADADIAMSSKEAIFLISKMTERFIRRLTEAGYTTAQLGGRRTLEYRDLATTVRDDDDFHFLREIIPVKVRLDEAEQKRRQKAVEDGDIEFDDSGHGLPRDLQLTSDGSLNSLPPTATSDLRSSRQAISEEGSGRDEVATPDKLSATTKSTEQFSASDRLDIRSW